MCPEVMSLVFWAFHDGGEGVGKLSDRHKVPARRPVPSATQTRLRSRASRGRLVCSPCSPKARDEPLYVDDREASDVLAVYRVMLASKFCVHVGGDTPTRKSLFDAIFAVCIPVLFQNDTVLFDSLPYADAIPYAEMVVHVPLMDELQRGERGDLLAHLHAVPPAEVARKQALLRRYAPLLRYPYQKLLSAPKDKEGEIKRATVDSRDGQENAVTMAIARLAADLEPVRSSA